MDNLSEAYLSVYQELDELYKGKHGQSDAEYQADRSPAGKRFSGDKDTGPRYYTLGRARGAKPDPPTAPGARPVGTPKLAQWEKDDIQYRKANLKAGKVHKVGGPKGLPEEEEFDLFDYLLEYLVAEGYANTNENAIAIMANMSEDWRAEILDEMQYTAPPQPAAEVRPAPAKKQQPSLEQQRRTASGVTAAKLALIGGTAAGVLAADRRASRPQKYKMEAVDLYNIILSHLLDEGYAETPEAAESIVMNMSEDWRESLILEYGAFGGRVSRGYSGTSERKRKGQERAQRRHELRSRAQRVVDNQRRGSHGEADSQMSPQPDRKRDYDPNSGWAHYYDQSAKQSATALRPRS